MTFYYLLLILHIVLGLICAHLVKPFGLKPESGFIAGAVLGGLGLCLCFLCISDTGKLFRRRRTKNA